MSLASIKIFPTIWSLGWWRVQSFKGVTTELRVFVGPVVITWCN